MKLQREREKYLAIMELETCSRILPTVNLLQPVEESASCDPPATLAHSAAVCVDEDETQQFHLLKIPSKEIVWVDTCAGFQKCVEIISEVSEILWFA